MILKKHNGRLKYLVQTKGIGLFTGTPGLGKTFAIKYFSNSLNSGLYKIAYICLSTITVREFYVSLCLALGLEPKIKKVDMYNQIQERIKYLVTEKKITPIIILDEAQYLKTDIFNDLKILLNFDMDSKDYAVLIIVGQPILNDILSRNIHEALRQRILVNYNFLGMDNAECKEYILDRFKLSGISSNSIEESAIRCT